MVDLASQRYLLLIEQIGAQLGHKYGWKSEVARRLGVDQTYISKLVTGSRGSVGRSTIDRAVLKLGLDPSFFYQRMPSPPSHVDFMRHSPARIDSIPAVESFLRGPDGDRVSDEHAEELRGIRFPERANITEDMIRAIWREMMVRDADTPEGD